MTRSTTSSAMPAASQIQPLASLLKSQNVP